MKGIIGDPRKWAILASLRPEFVGTLRWCCLFGQEGKEALLVDNEDNVWGFGPNESGCLGIGDTHSCHDPIKVVALCGRAVSSFAYGKSHVIALTKKGYVYGWGRNEYYQVGRSEPEKIYTPTLVYDAEDSAVEIACGYNHSACRTKGGAVYCWGYGLSGVAGLRHQKKTIPAKVNFNGDVKCTQISCCESTTLAVFENGHVYAWGAMRMTRIDFGDIIIRKVAGGRSHALAVSDNALLYVWGHNDEGQLGLGHTQPQGMNTMCHSDLMETYGPITEIAVSKYDEVSAVMTERLEVLLWGNSRGREVKIPTKVPCETVQDVFAMFSSVPATPVPLIMPSRFSVNFSYKASSSDSEWESSFLKTIAEHFDDPTFSDVKFRVGDQTIHVHKTVLKIQSEYFRAMLDGHWEENQSDTIEVKSSSYPIYKAFLRYFYTGKVELPAADALELLDLANSCCENRLKNICQKRIESTISIENCASVYLTALRCGADDLEDFCLNFAAKNLAAVAGTSALEELPDDVARKFLKGAAKATES